ncbi:MAG TPA: hypothetical protein VFE36_06540 [Candidatus Baltobacteraceae bacterium]|jgi:hypothetical protein|nr:hypothetical protein [Candidatus Baltobacteraceae bacterium]
MLADWIALNIPWWVIVLGLIGQLFWPLLGVTAPIGFLAWRLRKKWLRAFFLIPLVLLLVSALVNIVPSVDRAVETVQTHYRIYEPGRGMTGDVSLAHDTVIDGVSCSPTATANLDFLGHLTECTIPHPAIVRGVPCQGRVNVEYRVRCTLSADYRRFGYVWRAGTLVIDNGSGNVVFQVGPAPPTLTQNGSSLPPNTEVQFDGGKLLAITAS